MRYCLNCHHFSAETPLCTQCGSSFGGRLCLGKKYHLNPPDAKVCGQCGTTELRDAAASIGCSGRFLFFGLLVALLWWGSPLLLTWAGSGFYQMTGFRSPLVWLMETFGRVFIFLFIFHMLSLFMPGDTGQKFRGLITTITLRCLKFAFDLVGQIVWKIFLLTIQWLFGSAIEGKAKKG